MLWKQNNKDNHKHHENTIYTVTANCQDCYRCVRVCPVKAIRVNDGQAWIEDDLCIKCGTCVRECPQHAKTIRSSIDTVEELLNSGKMVAASIAPSFAAVFSGWRSTRLPAALRKLGFCHVSETAEGAKLITEHAFNENTAGTICTACPAVVNYIEKYRPAYIDKMIPIVSPMVAHGRMIKKRLGNDCAVVFIGPCAAKKEEALREENIDAIDAVLTFTELEQWFEREEIELVNCSESGFESFGDLHDARLFPLQGGMLKTGGKEVDSVSSKVLHLSGAEDVISLFDLPEKDWKYDVIEPLFCAGGCINGPGMICDKNIFARKQDIIAYAQTANSLASQEAQEINTQVAFQSEDSALILEEVDENKINQVLESTGKSSPEFQLNCGACGYKTCRENAIAVVRGMAEPEMCMPYMRRLAQQHTDRIIETTPNGVVVLDRDLNIIKMNPAFQRMFMCNNSMLGRRISYLLNSDGFEKLATGSAEMYDSIKSKYGMKYHEQLYSLPDEKQYIGIYTDEANIRFDNSHIDLIKSQTLEHAKELLDHQIHFSQEMAHYLGKSTAQTEELVKRLMDLYSDENL